jgi:DNA-binding NarL/FixJ family response regulator
VKIPEQTAQWTKLAGGCDYSAPSESTPSPGFKVLVLVISQDAVKSLARMNQSGMAVTQTRPDDVTELQPLAGMPDVVALCLVQLLSDRAVDTVATIRPSFPDANILAVSYQTQADVPDPIEADVREASAGWIDEATLVAALQLTADGRIVTDRGDAPTGSGRGEEMPLHERLTGREWDVYQQMVKGLTNAQIAANLSIARSTVKTHIERILSKIGAADRKHAIIMAYEFGIGLEANGRSAEIEISRKGECNGESI